VAESIKAFNWFKNPCHIDGYFVRILKPGQLGFFMPVVGYF